MAEDVISLHLLTAAHHRISPTEDLTRNIICHLVTRAADPNSHTV